MASSGRLVGLPPTCTRRASFKLAPCTPTPRFLHSYTIGNSTVSHSTASHRLCGPAIPTRKSQYRVRATRAHTLCASTRAAPLHTQAAPSVPSLRAEYEQPSHASQPNHASRSSQTVLSTNDSQAIVDEVPLPQPQVLSASWLDLSFTSTLSVQQILFGHAPLESSLPYQPHRPLAAMETPVCRTDDHDAPTSSSIVGRSYWSFNP